MDSSVSAAVAPLAASILTSLSCSTMTHSGCNWVANLMRSMTSRSVGSAPPTNSRLPRRDRATTWYCCASFASMTFCGMRCTSIAAKSSSGSASALESVWARSNADTCPLAITALTKLVFFSCACLTRSSAVLAWSLPECTSMRATPDREDWSGSASVVSTCSCVDDGESQSNDCASQEPGTKRVDCRDNGRISALAPGS